MLKRWRIGLLGAAVSLLAVYFILSQVNATELGRALLEARYIYLLPTVALLLLGLVARAVRWRILLSAGLPLRRAFSIMNVAYLVNGVLPLRLGEVARVYLGTRADPPVPALKTASTIVVERLLDLLAVVLLLTLALAAGDVPVELRTAASVAAPVALGGFLLLVFLARQREIAQRLLRLTLHLLPGGERHVERLSRWLDHFLDGLKPLTRLATLGQALLWTLIGWGFSVAAGYILMLAFYDQASWVATCLYIAAAAFAIAVPAVPGNLGTYELSILVALSATGYGQPADTAAAFALVVHGVNLGVHAATGLIGFVQEGISLGQLSRGVQEMR